MNILNKRPEEMNFNDYRAHLKEQKIWLKNQMKGRPLAKEEQEERNKKILTHK